MKYFLIAGGVTLAVGIGLVCLLVARRDASKKDIHKESSFILLPEFRPPPR